MSAGIDLNGRVALVTGAARTGGIGVAIARALAAAGSHVVLSDIGASDQGLGSMGELEQRVEEIKAEGGSASQVVCDVREETSVIQAVESILAAHERIDYLINNAGVGFLMAPITETRIEDWDRVLEVNLRGAFLTTKHVARAMIASGGGGRIVNIASQAAKSGFPHAAGYCASKHGMVGLTRVSAIEFGPHGITVNAVCPNHITTGLGDWQNKYFSKLKGLSESDYLSAMENRIPLGRTGRTSDIANACVFLCSDAAEYITGEALNVSGGEEMH